MNSIATREGPSRSKLDRSARAGLYDPQRSKVTRPLTRLPALRSRRRGPDLVLDDEGPGIALDERVWPHPYSPLAHPASAHPGRRRLVRAATISVPIVVIASMVGIALGQWSSVDASPGAGGAGGVGASADDAAGQATIDGGPGKAVLRLDLPERSRVHVSIFKKGGGDRYQDLGQMRLGVRRTGRQRVDLAHADLVQRETVAATTWVSPRISFRTGPSASDAEPSRLAPGRYVGIVQMRSP